MSIKNWPGGRISPTPPTPSGPYETSTASGVWTLDQVAYWRQQNLWPIAGNPTPDPSFKYVTLLLPGNGTNGAQNNTFLDSSSNNFSITRNGVTTQGTFSPYGSNWSNYFDGSGDYLSAPNNAVFNFGSGNFTIELWFNQSVAARADVVTKVASAGYAPFVLVLGNTLYPQFYMSEAGSGWQVSLFSSTTFTLGTWNHLAVVRNGTTITMYLNGVSVATQTGYSGSPMVNTDPVLVGGDTYSLNGYLSNVRIVKGTAVYTAAFTPPTAPLTAITNTSLLTCQSSRFVDNSSNAFTITRNGDVNVQRFSPFSPTAAYSAATIGGSGYFDGASWLDNPSSSTAYAFGTGDFTIEGFAYRDVAGTSDAGLFALSNGLRIVRYSSSTIRFILGSTTIGETVPSIGQWFHWAAVRQSGTMYLYINGVSTFSSANSTNVTGSISSTIGRASTSSLSNFYTGFLSSIRVTKGAALYTANFTPPSTPLTTTVSGGTVELLTNFTNAGIIDNAMMTDLETVGNAQISTAQSKFGGGSIYFNSSNADYLNVIAGSVLGTGDFTIEFWQYVSSLPATSAPFSFGTSDTASSCEIYIATNGTIYWYANAERITSSSGVITTGTWQHIAVTRASGTTRLFVNGIQRGSNYADTTNYSNGLAYIGRGYGVGGLLGYIDDFRITRGYARYTANFTPPAAPFPTF